MLLITDLNENVEPTLLEENGKKQLYIEGIFMQAEQVNRNGRIYKKPILESAVNDFLVERVNAGRGQGELDHPSSPKINSDRISHRITELRWDKNDVYGKALVLDTPCGNIVRGLVEGGVRIGVSSRGTGTITTKSGQNYVNEDFALATVDVVQDPSAPSAFVNGILESADWADSVNPVVRETCVREIKKASSKELNEAKLRVWQHFLASLRNK